MPQLFAARDQPIDVGLLPGFLRVGRGTESQVRFAFFGVDLLRVGHRAGRGQAVFVLRRAGVQLFVGQLVVTLAPVRDVPAGFFAFDVPFGQVVDIRAPFL